MFPIGYLNCILCLGTNNILRENTAPKRWEFQDAEKLVLNLEKFLTRNFQSIILLSPIVTPKLRKMFVLEKFLKAYQVKLIIS